MSIQDDNPAVWLQAYSSCLHDARVERDAYQEKCVSLLLSADMWHKVAHSLWLELAAFAETNPLTNSQENAYSNFLDAEHMNPQYLQTEIAQARADIKAWYKWQAQQ